MLLRLKMISFKDLKEIFIYENAKYLLYLLNDQYYDVFLHIFLFCQIADCMAIFIYQGQHIILNNIESQTHCGHNNL